jgi:hypothetical protein
MSSKAIEFIRSGRSRTITLMSGLGFSIRTRLIGMLPLRWQVHGAKAKI